MPAGAASLPITSVQSLGPLHCADLNPVVISVCLVSGFPCCCDTLTEATQGLSPSALFGASVLHAVGELTHQHLGSPLLPIVLQEG